MSPLDPQNTILVEYCCDPESNLGKVCDEEKVEKLRFCLPQRDATSVSDVDGLFQSLEGELTRGRHVRMHLAIPCTPWCGLTNITVKCHPKYKAKRTLQRLKSRRILRLFLDRAERLRRRFPQQFGGGFEWPRHSEGWREDLCPEIRRLKRLFPHRRPSAPPRARCSLTDPRDRRCAVRRRGAAGAAA